MATMPLAPGCDLFVLCGEASGDAYAGAIVAALRRRDPDLMVAAMAGPATAAAGAEIEQGIEGLGVMGLGPVLARLPEFIRLGWRIEALIRARRPKVVLTIDYPGFNLRMVRRLADLRRSGTRFVHVVAPQVWAWRPRRAKRIAASVDRLLCFFPFEPPLFNRFAPRLPIQADFVGHPMLDLVDGDGLAPVAPGPRVLMLAPGSRAREVEALLPVFQRAVELALPRLSASGPVEVLVSRVPELALGQYRAHTHFPLVDGGYRALCRRAHLGLIASGTATLEAALLGLPHVLAYRTDRLTATAARYLVRCDHVGLPNLVAERRVIPEVLQDECTPGRLAAHLVRLWEGPSRSAMQAGLREVRKRLGGHGAVQRIADILHNELDAGRRGETARFAPGAVARSTTEYFAASEVR